MGAPPHSAADAAGLASRLRHVFWIGGGSGAGKSTIATRLAREHGMRLYSTDRVMTNHAARTTAKEAPPLKRFAAVDMDERWVLRSPASMLETFHWFAGEGFELIIEDLLQIPTSPRVLVEGFRLLPKLVEPLLFDARQAVWLLPDHDFRRDAFMERGSLWDIASRTSDPQRALDNLLERDRLFTNILAEQVRQLGLCAPEVNASTSTDELTAIVATSVRLRLVHHPEPNLEALGEAISAPSPLTTERAEADAA